MQYLWKYEEETAEEGRMKDWPDGQSFKRMKAKKVVVDGEKVLVDGKKIRYFEGEFDLAVSLSGDGIGTQKRQ
jgi:hypothetical protein